MSKLRVKFAILMIAVYVCSIPTSLYAMPGMAKKSKKPMDATTPMIASPEIKASESGSSNNAITLRLENGLKVTMIENHATPLISVFIGIKAGSATEDYKHNGITHFLEHMLFNGTTKRTQQEIYDEMDLIGGYNNAYTRKDYTAFMITIPIMQQSMGGSITGLQWMTTAISPPKAGMCPVMKSGSN